MKNKTTLIIVIALVAFAGLSVVLWPYAFTVVPIEQVEAKKLSEAFDPVAYVDKIWDSKIIPTITQKATDLKTILGEMHPDSYGFAKKDALIAIAKKYGSITVGEAHVYMVRGQGKIISVDTSSSTGLAEIQLDGYSGPIKVLLYVGPRIPSDETSVRDAVGFLNFGDFKEQTEYGKVAAEINKRVVKQVLGTIDKNSLQGKTVSFDGTLTIRTFNLIDIDLKKVTIVPIKIDVKG